MSQKHCRDPQRERFWREAVAEWAKSGQSIRAFCAGRGLREPSFYAWRRSLRERAQQRPTTRPRATGATLVPLRVIAEAVLEVVLPAGVVVPVSGLAPTVFPLTRDAQKEVLRAGLGLPVSISRRYPPNG